MLISNCVRKNIGPLPQLTRSDGGWLGVSAVHTAENPCTAVQSAVRTRGSTSADSTYQSAWDTFAEENLWISGLVKFKPKSFKGQWHLHLSPTPQCVSRNKVKPRFIEI